MFAWRRIVLLLNISTNDTTESIEMTRASKLLCFELAHQTDVYLELIHCPPPGEQCSHDTVELTCTILCFVLVLGKTKTKLFLVLQWYFDLSKQKALVFVLTKPKQNRAGQLLREEVRQ